LEFVKSTAWTKMAGDAKVLAAFLNIGNQETKFMVIIARLCMSLRRLPVISLIAAIWSPVLESAFLYAEPITFQFNAEVVSVSAGSPFNLPFTYEVGDVMTGTFTFEPAPGSVGGNSIAANQAFPFQISINGTLVGSSVYRIEAFNNTPITDSEFESPVDSMSIGCSEPACIPNYVSLSVGDPFRVRSRMNLLGEMDTFPTALISDEPADWNALDLQRTLSITFDNQGPGSMGLLARVGEFIAVPEPNSSGLAICAAFFAVAVLIAGRL
jgi:hypothetical protein